MVRHHGTPSGRAEPPEKSGLGVGYSLGMSDSSTERMARQAELAIRIVALSWAAVGVPSCGIAAIASGKPILAFGSLLSSVPLAAVKLIPAPCPELAEHAADVRCLPDLTGPFPGPP